MHDHDGVVIDANRSAERILGIPRDDLGGRLANDARLTRLRENGEPCDPMMPHLSGNALYEIVREQSPVLAERSVFISGGATDPRVQHFLASVPNERLDKPFDIREIQQMTRRHAARSRISN